MEDVELPVRMIAAENYGSAGKVEGEVGVGCDDEDSYRILDLFDRERELKV